MSQENWRDQWDNEASREYQRYMEMPLDKLIANFRKGNLGDYRTIWNALAERAKLQDLGWDLYGFLQSDKDYLERYHCARILLQLMNSKQFEPVELSAKRGDQMEKNLKTLARLLEEKIGPQP